MAAVASGNQLSVIGWWFTHDENAIPPSEYKGALVAKARSKPVDVENIITGEITRYDSAKAAGETLSIHRSQISLAIKNKKPLRNYKFRFADANQPVKQLE